MADHNQLRAFKLADELVLKTYQLTREFPEEEKLGLALEIRKSALAIPTAIVEGAAQQTTADFIHYLYQAYNSAKKLEYLISLPLKLEYLSTKKMGIWLPLTVETYKAIKELIRSLKTKN